MLERIKKNKLFWIVAIVIIAVLIGSIVIVITSRDSEEAGKSNDGSKVEYDGEEPDEEFEEGAGLKVEEDNVTPNASIDASGSWDDTASNKVDTNETVEEEEQDTTPNESDNETDEKENSESNVSDGDILEGDSWTKPR